MMEIAGKQFLPTSPQQVAEILFSQKIDLI